MGIDDQLRQAKDFATQVEGVSEPGLLALLSCQRLHWLEVHVIVEVQVIEVLRTMCQQLTADD